MSFFKNFVISIGKVAKSFSNTVYDDTAVRNRSKNIIGFYGAAENSGTTTLVANIAEYLSGSHSPTVIVDFNLDAPSGYRYIVDEEVPENKSLVNKFKNPSLSPSEIVVGDVNKLGIVSMTGYEHPADYCSVSLSVIDDLLRVLSTHYKYVLVDLGTSLNSNPTIQGILTCDKVYSIVRPVTAQISKLLATKEHIENLGHLNKIKDVVQTLCLNDEYSFKDFEETGLNLIGNVALDFDLKVAADNCKIVTQIGKSKAASNYLKLIKSMGEDIKKMVEQSASPTINDVLVGGDRTVMESEGETK